MTYQEARKSYEHVSGIEFTKPDRARSYTRNTAWHLLDKAGSLLAVVTSDGRVSHGAMLQRVIVAQAARRKAG